MGINREALWDRLGYKPHPKQLLFHDSQARFKIPVCGRRFGKSKMAAMEVLPTLMDPTKQVRGWIIAPNYKTGEYEFRYIWDALVKLGVLNKVKRKAYNPLTGSLFIEMPWGSRIDVMSAAHKDNLVGEGLDFAILSEAAKQDRATWEKYIRPSLADKRGTAIFPSTPEGFNWYYDVYAQGQSEDHEYESWNFPSWENPYVYPGGFEDHEIQSQLRNPDDPWFWQEIGASFRSVVGLVYQEWKDDTHIIDGYQYHPEWDNYLAFDFGFTNPFCALDIQVSPNDDIYIWRERYVSKETISTHARELLHRVSPPGYSVICGYGDAASPGDVEELSRLLTPTIADPDAKVDKMRGIQEVKRFLIGEDKLPHLFVDRKACPNTIWEFQNYRMMNSRRETENAKEDTVKFGDHALDAARYFVMHHFVLGMARYGPRDIYDVREIPLDDKGIFTRSDDNVFTMSNAPRW